MILAAWWELGVMVAVALVAGRAWGGLAHRRDYDDGWHDGASDNGPVESWQEAWTRRPELSDAQVTRLNTMLTGPVPGDWREQTAAELAPRALDQAAATDFYEDDEDPAAVFAAFDVAEPVWLARMDAEAASWRTRVTTQSGLHVEWLVPA